jgi:hypothetical protein
MPVTATMRPSWSPAMRLSLILPPVEPMVSRRRGTPARRMRERHVQHWQEVSKPLWDTQLAKFVAPCYGLCGRTFRVSPHGVGHDQTSGRLKGVAVQFSVLGMSYGAGAAALVTLGWPLGKVAVSYAVQEFDGTGRRNVGRDQQRR